MPGTIKRGLPRWDEVKPWEKAFQGWEAVDEIAEVAQRVNDDWQTNAQRGERIPANPFQIDGGVEGTPRPPLSVTVCEVESFAGGLARCLAEVAGSRLPVDIPAWVLRSHNLSEGMRFEWRMSEDGSIYPADLRPLPALRLSPSEEEERQRLWEEYVADPATDIWGNQDGE